MCIWLHTYTTEDEKQVIAIPLQTAHLCYNFGAVTASLNAYGLSCSSISGEKVQMKDPWKREDELQREVTDCYVLCRRVIWLQYLIMTLFDWGQSQASGTWLWVLKGSSNLKTHTADNGIFVLGGNRFGSVVFSSLYCHFQHWIPQTSIF